MTLSIALNLSGLILNIFGSILLAVCLSKYLLSFHGAIAIHDMTIKALVRKDTHAWVAQDMGNLLTKGVKNGRSRTRFGLILICLGFILQLLPILIDLCSKVRSPT